MGWPEVTAYSNEEQVVAEVMNRPLRQLEQRTNYLKRILDNNNDASVCIEVDVVDDGTGYPEVGQPVYRNAGGYYAKAIALAGQGQWFYADQEAMAVGVVKSRTASRAVVVLYGSVTFADLPAEQVIADPKPTSGRYFLSAKKGVRGMLTAEPGGPVVYVCDCQIESGKIKSMLVSPQYRDTGESHIHREFVLNGSPIGGATKHTTWNRYVVTNIPSDDAASPLGVTLIPYGVWTSQDIVKYTFTLSGTDLTVSSTAEDEPDTVIHDVTFSASGVSGLFAVGSRGLRIQLAKTATYTAPSRLTWTLNMPDDARGWLNYYRTGESVPAGFRLNLGMYPEAARFVPPVPANGATVFVDGSELLGPVFGDRKRWEMVHTVGSALSGGPWLIWYGGEIDNANATAPFKWDDAKTPHAVPRDILFSANRMRVGPTGFVTSLQPAPGAPLKITSAETGASANQGALQIGLDVNFSTGPKDVPGFEVVKRIKGTVFETGPVVEKIIAGPGINASLDKGAVTLSLGNVVYSGDFETIALINAKQDMAGGVFPYTRLLGWNNDGHDTASGFTAKFRVPDNIPWKEYNVVISASVFGEAAATSDMQAFFRLSAYTLPDYACSPEPESSEHLGGIDRPDSGATSLIPIRFNNGYNAFDPELIHGFPDTRITDIPADKPGQRQRVQSLLLKQSDGTSPIVVKPGYFVGIRIDRTGPGDSSSVVPYTRSIGFVSLRWNLVVNG